MYQKLRRDERRRYFAEHNHTFLTIFKMLNFNNLLDNIAFLTMPSTLWAPHIDPKRQYFAVLHLNVSNKKIAIDKGILVASNDGDDIQVNTYLNGTEVYLENVEYNVKSSVDVENILFSLHNIDQNTNILDELDISSISHLEPKDTNFSDAEILAPTDEASLEYECVKCSLTFLEENLLHKHQKEHEKTERTKEKRSLCNICGKTFGLFSLKDHMLTHTLEKPYECIVCRKTFAKSYNLKMHEYTHTGKRPYICSDCGKSYTAQSNLRTHMKTAHKTLKKHVCETCKMSFVYPRYLRIHVRKHTGEKPFVCKVCGRSFSQKIHLTVHLRSHTGEKPHICDVCKKSFTTTGNLMAHRRATKHQGII